MSNKVFKIPSIFRSKMFLLAFLPILIFSVITLYYMLPVMTQCSSRVLSFGDSTAGPIWLHFASPQLPLWGFTHLTNYPFGEMLSQPVYASGLIQYLTYWIFSTLTGAVCGYNVLNFVGFVFSAYVMFLFIKWLTKNYWLAIFAGYAVSFTPYYQAKVGVHPSYGYQGILILLLWFSLLLIKNNTKKLALYLALIFGVCFYWDPYFPLLGISILVPLGILSVLWYAIKKPAELKGLLKNWLIFTVTSLILIIPLVAIRVTQANQITSFVSSSRNSTIFDAGVYSNRPLEYLMPAENNPFFVHLLHSKLNSVDRHGSNPGEYIVSLSLTLLSISSIGLIIIIWEYALRKKWPIKKRLNLEPKLAIIAIISVMVMAFLVSLPPKYHGITNISYVIASHIDIWRVFSRLYVVLNIGLVTLASICLFLLLGAIKNKWLSIAVLVLVFLAVAVEYQAYSIPRPTWSFNSNKNISDIYRRLEKRDDIKVLAEYPLAEPAKLGIDTSEYFTFQIVHHKTLFNSYLPNSKQADFRFALRDLNDPQTAGVLKAYGVDAVMVRDYTPDKSQPKISNQFELIDNADSGCGGKCTLWLYKISSNVKKISESYIDSQGYFLSEYWRSYDVNYDLSKMAIIKRKDITGSEKQNICFSIVSANGNLVRATVDSVANNQQITIGPEAKYFDFDSDTVSIKSNGDKDLQISELGCQ